MTTYRNGRVPNSKLAFIQGRQRAKKSVKADFLAFKRFAYEHGIQLRIAVPSGAYRSVWTQKRMRRFPKRYNLVPGVSLALVGFSSHGQGDNLDVYANPLRSTISVESAWAFVLRNMGRYGFTQRDRYGDPHCLHHN